MGDMRNGHPIGERPTRFPADGAFFVAQRGGRLAVKDAGGTSRKRQFEPGSPRQISGTVSAPTLAAPCRQPRDSAPWYPTVGNIAPSVRFFHRVAGSPNMTDSARHEYPLSRQAD
jgi:hypothetical protein